MNTYVCMYIKHTIWQNERILKRFLLLQLLLFIYYMMQHFHTHISYMHISTHVRVYMNMRFFHKAFAIIFNHND